MKTEPSAQSEARAAPAPAPSSAGGPPIPQAAPQPPPPGFGRYPWWMPLLALGIGLGALALPLGALSTVEFPFGASVGEGLFVAMLLGVAFALTSYRHGRPRPAELGLRPTPARAAVGWVVVARITFAILAGIYAAAVGGVHPNAPVGPLHEVSTVDAVDAIVAAVVLAPFGEELFFRGFMYASLRGRFSAFWSALIAGGLFAAVHPIYGATRWDLVPVLAIAGFAMCLLYERTGSLWPSIAFHVSMNIGVVWVVTGSAAVPLAVTGGAALLFLIAPWRFRRAAQQPARARRWQPVRPIPH